MVYYNKETKRIKMGTLFKVKTADEVEDKLLKVIEKYQKSIEKEGLEGNLVGLNGFLFAKRAKDKIEGMGIQISNTQINLLKEAIANKQTDRMNEIVSSVSQKSGLPNSSTAGRFKQENLGVKGSRLDSVADTGTVGSLMTGNPLIGTVAVIGYAAYKGIAALVNKASDMAYKSSLNKDVLALPIMEPRKNRNNIA